MCACDHIIFDWAVDYLTGPSSQINSQFNTLLWILFPTDTPSNMSSQYNTHYPLLQVTRTRKEEDEIYLKKQTAEVAVAPSSSSPSTSHYSCFPLSLRELLGLGVINHHNHNSNNNSSSSSSGGLLAASRGNGPHNTATVAVTAAEGTNIGTSGRGGSSPASPHLRRKNTRKFSEKFSKLRKFSALGPSKRFIPSISEG